MHIHIHSSLRRVAAALLLAGGLGGCAVYGPPYAYDTAYAYPAYVGRPVSLDLGFAFYDRPRHGHYRHHHHHGWRGHGWGHHRGGWGHHHRGGRHGRH